MLACLSPAWRRKVVMACETIVLRELGPRPRCRLRSICEQQQRRLCRSRLALEPNIDREIRGFVFHLLAPMSRHVGQVSAVLKGKPGVPGGDEVMIDIADRQSFLWGRTDMTAHATLRIGGEVARRRHARINLRLSRLAMPVGLGVRL